MPKNLQSGLSTVCRAPVGLLISLEGIKSIWIFPGCRKVGFPGGKCDGSLPSVPPTLSLCWDYPWPWKWCSLALQWRCTQTSSLWESSSWYLYWEKVMSLCFTLRNWCPNTLQDFIRDFLSLKVLIRCQFWILVQRYFYPQDVFFFLWKKWKENNSRRF